MPRAASTLDELLSDPEIEGVLVTTPNDTHKTVILECLDAGKARLHRQADSPHDGGRRGDRPGRGRLRGCLSQWATARVVSVAIAP